MGIVSPYRGVGSVADHIASLASQRAELLAALKALVIDANRLCDRQQGGSYEDDCRSSLAIAKAAIAKAEVQ